MIDKAKRLTEDMLEHRHDPGTPWFTGIDALFERDGHVPGIHTDEGIAMRCKVFSIARPALSPSDTG